jgi:hypothetical protein
VQGRITGSSGAAVAEGGRGTAVSVSGRREGRGSVVGREEEGSLDVIPTGREGREGREGVISYGWEE